MQYHPLGTSSLKVSEIGFGCMSLPTDFKTAAGLLRSAVDGGINYFDTADLYEAGKNEEILGTALKPVRRQVIIATKAGNQLRADGKGWDWNPSAKYIREAAENSLRRLQTDYIDLFQLHGGTLQDPIDETIGAFEDLKREGKILFYGISSIRPNLIREYVSRSPIVSVMMQYSLLDRRPEEACLDLLEENNIGLLARGVLAKGLLAGKAPEEYLGYKSADLERLHAALLPYVTENRSAAHTAIRYVLQQPGVAATVIGIRTAAQLKEALSVPASDPLTNDERSRLGQILPANRYQDHR